MKKYWKWILTTAAILLIVGIMVSIVVFLLKSGNNGDNDSVYSVVTAEAGEAFDFSAFLKMEGLTAEPEEGSVYDLNKVGDYPITLVLSNGARFKVTLAVRDSIAPRIKDVPPLIVKKGEALLPDVALPKELIVDATNVRVSYLSASADTETEGQHTVSLRLEDEGGNVSRVEIQIYVTEQFNADYRYEIGTAMPTAEELLPGVSASFREIDRTVSVPGPVSEVVNAFGGEYIVRYQAVDTIAPQVTVKDQVFSYVVGESLPADPFFFIASVIDATEVKAEYLEEYLFDQAENKKLQIAVTDLGGNRTVVEVIVSVFDAAIGADTVPPVISGTKDLVTEPGVKPDYLAGVTAFDGRDGVIDTSKIMVDDSAVNLNVLSAEGYPVVYSVRDQAGNIASVTIYLKIVRPLVSAEEMNALIDEKVAELQTAGLSRFSVLSKVYNYITTQYFLMPGEANSAVGDITEEAYWSFKLRTGNHESYYAMAAVLLEKLDIEYIRVTRRAVGSTEHTWLLVDYGVGWLYFDCMPIDGYIWTKDGRIYRTDSEEGMAVSPVNIRDREAMTDADIAQLTELLNQEKTGWNYYKINTSNGVLPATAVRNPDGSYTSQQYTIKYQSSAGGKLSGSTVQVVRHGQEGSAVTALPNPGYRFVGWSDGVTDIVRTDKPLSSMTVTAIFELDSATLSHYTVKYEASENGSITGTTEQWLLYGKRTTAVTAVPKEGYYFVGWDDGVTSATRQDTVSKDITYRAIFAKKISYTYYCTEGGEIDGANLQTVIPGTSGSYVTAKAKPGYRFTGWSDGVASETRRDTDVIDITVTALFEKETGKNYTVKYTAETGGSIEGSAVQTAAVWSATKSVTAVAEKGYSFVGWSDGVTSETRSDAVLADATYTACFEKITFTVSYIAGEGGSILGTAEYTVQYLTEIGPVEAVAQDGYRFIGWSDGETAAIRSDMVTEDISYTALFEKIETSEPKPEPQDPNDSESGMTE